MRKFKLLDIFFWKIFALASLGHEQYYNPTNYFEAIMRENNFPIQLFMAILYPSKKDFDTHYLDLLLFLVFEAKIISMTVNIALPKDLWKFWSSVSNS